MMDLKTILYPRPLKFVVVGEVASGKTTLINRFLSGASKTGDEYKPTFVCDGSTLTLKAAVKKIHDDASTKVLDEMEIEKRLRDKKIKATPGDPRGAVDEKWRWDKISVTITKAGLQLPRSDPKNSGKEMAKSTSELPESCAKHGGGGAARPARPQSMVVPKCVTPKNNRKNCLGKTPTILAVPKTPPRKPPRKEGVAKLNLSTTCPECTGAASANKGRRLGTLGEGQNVVSQVRIKVNLWDTGGDRRFMWYRWYACTDADAVLMCVPLSSVLAYGEKLSLAALNARQGAPEGEVSKNLQKFMTDEFLSARTRSCKSDYRVPPVVLVGTKADLCAGKTGPAIADENIDSIGLRLAAEVGCCDFVQCSGFDGRNIFKVFETAVAASLTSEAMYRTSDDVTLASQFSESEAESSLSREVEQPTYFRMRSSTPYGNGCEEEDLTSDEPELVNVTSGDAVVYDSLVRRSPRPQIHFPPPPASTPPSTGPPSSESSRSPSARSVSLESVSDSDNPASTLALCGSAVHLECLTDDISGDDETLIDGVTSTSNVTNAPMKFLEADGARHNGDSEINVATSERGITMTSENNPDESSTEANDVPRHTANPMIDDATQENDDTSNRIEAETQIHIQPPVPPPRGSEGVKLNGTVSDSTNSVQRGAAGHANDVKSPPRPKPRIISRNSSPVPRRRSRPQKAKMDDIFVRFLKR